MQSFSKAQSGLVRVNMSTYRDQNLLVLNQTTVIRLLVELCQIGTCSPEDALNRQVSLLDAADLSVGYDPVGLCPKPEPEPPLSGVLPYVNLAAGLALIAACAFWMAASCRTFRKY